MKEKLRLLQDFLRDDTQDQLKRLEDKLKNSELSSVSLVLSVICSWFVVGVHCEPFLTCPVH